MTTELRETTAQRALLRLLRTSFGEEAACNRAIRASLDHAGIHDLPREAVALLGFVRAHVVPSVRGQLTPQLIAALIEDLEAEVEYEQTKHDPSSSSRIANATRMPTAPLDGAAAMMAIPSYRPPSRADMKANTDDRVTAPPPAPASGSITRQSEDNGPETVPRPGRRQRDADERAAVLLVDPDRLGRTALARALVNAGFDVTVLDDPTETARLIATRPVIDLLLTEIEGLDVNPILKAIVAHRPGVPVIAWTKAARATANHVLRTSDVATFEIAGKAARIGDVVELARKLTSS